VVLCKYRSTKTDLGFGEYAWTAKIYTSDPGDEKAGNTITVDICKITPDGTVTVIASGSETLQSGKKEYDINCADNTDTTQDFSTGDWLGARVSWNGPANHSIRIYYNPNYSGKDKLYYKSCIGSRLSSFRNTNPGVHNHRDTDSHCAWSNVPVPSQKTKEPHLNFSERTFFARILPISEMALIYFWVI